MPLPGWQVGALELDELQPTPQNRTPEIVPRTCPLNRREAIMFASAWASAWKELTVDGVVAWMRPQ